MKRFASLLLLITLMFPLLILSASSEVDRKGDLAIVFTHDIHSHLDSFVLDGESVGGVARIKSVIDKVRNDYDNTLVLDGGDFSMGTLFQTVFETSASEYQILGALGYDATTFGNHEFDYGFDAVKTMINSAKNESTSLPPILCANIDAEASGFTENELNELNIYQYRIIKKGDYDIAVFGLLGRNAVELSSSSKIVFKDFIEAAKNTVSEIKNLYSPDVIICLSHSGTGDDVDDEDILLAEEVGDIDVIISGHTHTYLEEPIIVGNTVIASCGEYGENVGEILLNVEGDKTALVSYSLTKIDDSISQDQGIKSKVELFKRDISNYLIKFGYESADDVLAYSPFDFPEQSTMSDTLSEQQLGNLISDSYVYAVKEAEGVDYVPVDVAVTPVGVIRASIDKGDITVSQAFEISSLGIGNDGVSGYPLCYVYLYGRELWDLAEVDASVSEIMPYAQLYCSGLGYSVNTNRMILNRVYDCWLIDENGNRVEIEDDKLYRVVSGMSSAIMLGTVKSKSFGLLELTPKDRYGNAIEDFDQHIAIDKNGAEVKEWRALADYLSSFPTNSDDLPTIPEKYAVTEGRKNINNSFVFSEVFTKWNLVSWCFLAMISLVLFIVVIITVSIIKKKRKKKRASLALSDEVE